MSSLSEFRTVFPSGARLEAAGGGRDGTFYRYIDKEVSLTFSATTRRLFDEEAPLEENPDTDRWLVSLALPQIRLREYYGYHGDQFIARKLQELRSAILEGLPNCPAPWTGRKFSKVVFLD